MLLNAVFRCGTVVSLDGLMKVCFARNLSFRLPAASHYHFFIPFTGRGDGGYEINAGGHGQMHGYGGVGCGGEFVYFFAYRVGNGDVGRFAYTFWQAKGEGAIVGVGE